MNTRNFSYCQRLLRRSGIVGGLRNVTNVAMFPRVDFAVSAACSHDALIPPVESLAISRYISLKPFLEFNDVVASVPSAIANAFQLTRPQLDPLPETFTTAVVWHRKRSGKPLGFRLQRVPKEAVEE